MFGMPAQSSAAFGGFGASQPAFGAAPAFGAPAAPGMGGFGAPAAAFAGPQVPNTSVAPFQPSKGPDGSAAAGQTAAQATYMSITHMAPYQVSPFAPCTHIPEPTPLLSSVEADGLRGFRTARLRSFEPVTTP